MLKTKLLAMTLLSLLALSAWATTLKCAADGGNLWYTGKTQIVSGTVLYQHRCAQGHFTWLNGQQMNQ